MRRSYAILITLLCMLPGCASGGATVFTAVTSSPGGDLEGLERGYGLELARTGSERPFQMGLGTAVTRHAADGGVETWLIDAYLEPRLAFGGRLQTVVPFVGARLGGSMVSYSYGELDLEASSDFGYVYGGNGGAMIFLKRNVAIEAGLGYYQQSIFSVDEEEVAFESKGDGSRMQLGLGLRWGR